MNLDECNVSELQYIKAENAKLPYSPIFRLKLFIRRHLGMKNIQKFFSLLDYFKVKRNDMKVITIPTQPLKAGDIVRVRSKEEIEATLDSRRKLKGCSFMYEQQLYCGTEQRVFKVMEHFVDERDLKLKKCRGLVLLDGVMCQGSRDWGRCDRSCFIFWREEWLEKVKNDQS